MKTVITILEITAGVAFFNLLLAVAITVYQMFCCEKRESRKSMSELSQHSRGCKTSGEQGRCASDHCS
jgi:hypothetical protein